MILFLVFVSLTATLVATDSSCPERCRPSCTVPNPKYCNLYRSCAYCGKGNLWDEEGKRCVQINQCTYGKGCNGEKNAYVRANPPSCPATCKNPNESVCHLALSVGCLCSPGYILSGEGGKCIKTETCPDEEFL